MTLLISTGHRIFNPRHVNHIIMWLIPSAEGIWLAQSG